MYMVCWTDKNKIWEMVNDNLIGSFLSDLNDKGINIEEVYVFEMEDEMDNKKYNN